MEFIFLSTYICFVFISIIVFSKWTMVHNRIREFAEHEWGTTVAPVTVVCALVWPLVYVVILASLLLTKLWHGLLWFADKMLSKPEINSGPDNYRKAADIK